MTQAHLRPFYYDFAWAYEYIIDAPLTERRAFIERVIRRMRLQRAYGCSLLDVDQATTAQPGRSVDFRS